MPDEGSESEQSYSDFDLDESLESTKSFKPQLSNSRYTKQSSFTHTPKKTGESVDVDADDYESDNDYNEYESDFDSTLDTLAISSASGVSGGGRKIVKFSPTPASAKKSQQTRAQAQAQAVASGTREAKETLPESILALRNLVQKLTSTSSTSTIPTSAPTTATTTTASIDNNNKLQILNGLETLETALLTHRISTLQSNKTKHKEKKAKLRRADERRSAHVKNLYELKVSNEQLKVENDRWKAEFGRLEKEKERGVCDSIRLNGYNQDLEVKCQSLTGEVNTINGRNAGLQLDVKNHLNTINTLTNENQRSNLQVTELTSQLKKQELQIFTLQTHLPSHLKSWRDNQDLHYSTLDTKNDEEKEELRVWRLNLNEREMVLTSRIKSESKETLVEMTKDLEEEKLRVKEVLKSGYEDVKNQRMELDLVGIRVEARAKAQMQDETRLEAQNEKLMLKTKSYEALVDAWSERLGGLDDREEEFNVKHLELLTRDKKVTESEVSLRSLASSLNLRSDELLERESNVKVGERGLKEDVVALKKRHHDAMLYVNKQRESVRSMMNGDKEALQIEYKADAEYISYSDSISSGKENGFYDGVSADNSRSLNSNYSSTSNANVNPNVRDKRAEEMTMMMKNVNQVDYFKQKKERELKQGQLKGQLNLPPPPPISKKVSARDILNDRGNSSSSIMQSQTLSQQAQVQAQVQAQAQADKQSLSQNQSQSYKYNNNEARDAVKRLNDLMISHHRS